MNDVSGVFAAKLQHGCMCVQQQDAAGANHMQWLPVHSWALLGPDGGG